MLQIQSYAMLVNETPVAFWDWNLNKKNMEFLEGLDTNYFKYIANTNLPKLETSDKHYAALTIRLAFSHGLEMLFSMLCSIVQAPRCTLGWILSYQNNDLKSMIKKISNEEIIKSNFDLNEVSWHSISKLIFKELLSEQVKDWLIKSYGEFWAKMAQIYLDDRFINEYNGIKHSFRITPGGFKLAVGKETIPDIPSPTNEMKSLGGSEFGASYFVRKRIVENNKVNLRIINQARNWDPVILGENLHLIASSIENIIVWLKALNNPKKESYNYSVPFSEEQFNALSRTYKGPLGFDFKVDINSENLNLYKKDEIAKQMFINNSIIE